MVLVSVVILNYNGRRFLRACIESLKRQTLQDFEIIFVDNASTDGSISFMESTYPDLLATRKLRVIRNATNQGFAEGNNIGHRAAKGKYVLLLNNDTTASPRLLERLVETMDSDRNIATAGGFVLDKGKERLYRRIIEKKRRAFTITLCGDNTTIPRARGETPVRTQFYGSGAAVMYRRNDMRSRGNAPFEPLHFLYAEDTYLGWRTMLAGKRNVMRIDAVVHHYGGGTQREVRSISKTAVFHGTKNQLMNILLFYEWKNIMRILPLLAVVQLGHIIENPRKLMVKPRAYWWILKNLQGLLRRRKEIQKTRITPDRDILKLISCKFYDPEMIEGETRRAMVHAMNRLFYAYCWVVRLKTREFYADYR